MALINMGTADGSTLGNPQAGEFYLFLDSNNGSQLTRRKVLMHLVGYLSQIRHTHPAHL
jgi:hypothetical protein